jgi:hypothetical protein
VIEVVDAQGQRTEVGEREWEALRTDSERTDLELPPWALRAPPATAKDTAAS